MPNPKTVKKSATENTNLAGVLIGVLPLLFILAGIGYGGFQLWKIALQDKIFAILPSVNLNQRAGLHPEAVQEFNRLSNLTAGKSLLDPYLLDTVKRQYDDSVWIKKVFRLERVFPNQIMVEFIPRRAFFQAKQNGYFWLVDDENIVLPVTGLRTPHQNLPIISGDINTRPQYGEKWQDSGIIAAHEVLTAIEKSPLSAQLPISEIIVNRPRFMDKFRNEQYSRARLEIKTHNEINILWGAGTRGDPDELTTNKKLALLQQLLQKPLPTQQEKVYYDVRTRIAGYSLSE